MMLLGILIPLILFTRISYSYLSQEKKYRAYLENQDEMGKEDLAKIEKYNERVSQGEPAIVDPFDVEGFNVKNEAYPQDEIFGYLSIPSIDFKKPIYLGATYDHMEKGVGQIDGTAIPVGGVGKRSVLAGHRGWYGDALLYNIGDVEVGDKITIDEHGNKLTYKVDNIEIIRPSEWEKLKPIDGVDMLTILSCEPKYPPFTHRILVNCIREDEQVTKVSSENFSGKESEEKVTETDGKVNKAAARTNRLEIFITLFLWAIFIWVLVSFIKKLKNERQSGD